MDEIKLISRPEAQSIIDTRELGRRILDGFLGP